MMSALSSTETITNCVSEPGELKASSPEFSGQTLGSWTLGRIVTSIGSLILSLIPILFIVVAILATSLSQKPITTPGGPALERVLILLPTLFPIAFAAIMGRFFKTVGLYLAERGVSLGTLECLVGCQSLFSTAERLYFLRRTDLISILILLFWVLSPVGGQSAIRLLTKEPVIATMTSTVRYLPIEIQADTYLDGTDAYKSMWGSYAPLFMLALLTQKTQDQPHDTLGNVKIPALNISQLSFDDSSWQTVDYMEEVQYTSLLGIPITGIPEQGNATFDIASRYWDVECSGNTWLGNKTELPGGWDDNSTEWTETASYFQPVSKIMSLQGKIPFYFMTGDPQGWPISLANCALDSVVVDSSISCTSGACRVTATRLGDQSAGSWYDDPVSLRHALESLPRTFLKNDYGTLKTISSLELWLMDPTSDLNQQVMRGHNIFRTISELPPDVLAARLRTVINSFWQSAYAASYIEGYIPADLDNFTSPYGYLPFSFNSSEARVEQQAGEKYVCQWVWAALLFGTSALLFLAACSTTVLHAIILAPDILGYVSSSARDNRQGTFSSYGSFLSGLEWAYRFRDIKVIVGDVCREGEQSRIGIALKIEDRPQRLPREEIYK